MRYEGKKKKSPRVIFRSSKSICACADVCICDLMPLPSLAQCYISIPPENIRKQLKQYTHTLIPIHNMSEVILTLRSHLKLLSQIRSLIRFKVQSSIFSIYSNSNDNMRDFARFGTICII